MMDYEAVIGLEIHVQLNSATKMFCDCPNIPCDQPNLNTCPVCLWMPGAVPGFSHSVLEKAVLLCLALNCEIQHESAFDQKVYYYPDLPKGYQLSQFHHPLSRNGWLDIAGENGNLKRLRIRNVHMEEDVAKLVHETEGAAKISLVDFNRAGSPLVEIVTEPDMSGSGDAMEFIHTLRRQIRYSGSSECSMEKGSMRVDANISIRAKGSSRFGTKVEVKNMNSIRSVGDAIDYEIRRQTEQISAGQPVVLHTRLWDPDKCLTAAMRGKFEGPCVPDPAVSRIVITDEWLHDLKSRLPEMPGRKVGRFVEQYKLTHDEAVLMSSERDLSEYFEDVVNRGIPSRTAVRWITAQLVPALKERGLTLRSSNSVSAENFGDLLGMLERNEITASLAKKVLIKLFETSRTPGQIVENSGFKQVSDTGELDSLVDTILSANPDAVNAFRSGKDRAMGFLVGQAMRKSQGRANPKLIQKLLIKKLR